MIAETKMTSFRRNIVRDEANWTSSGRPFNFYRHAASVGVRHGRVFDGRVAELGKAEHVRRDGGDHHADDRAHRRVDGAEASRRRRRRVADADVALDGQQHRQPDRRRVEYGRHVVGEATYSLNTEVSTYV